MHDVLRVFIFRSGLVQLADSTGSDGLYLLGLGAGDKGLYSER